MLRLIQTQFLASQSRKNVVNEGVDDAPDESHDSVEQRQDDNSECSKAKKGACILRSTLSRCGTCTREKSKYNAREQTNDRSSSAAEHAH